MPDAVCSVPQFTVTQLDVIFTPVCSRIDFINVTVVEIVFPSDDPMEPYEYEHGKEYEDDEYDRQNDTELDHAVRTYQSFTTPLVVLAAGAFMLLM